MRIVQIILLCFILSSCIFSTSNSPTFYTLTSQSNDVLSNKYKSFIGISSVRLPKYIERPQIVTQKDNSNEVIISEYNRWLENPSTLIARVLISDLSTLLPASQIKMRQVVTEKFDINIIVEIVKINTILGKQIEFEAWYMIENKSNTVILREKFNDTIEIGKSYNDLAEGYSHLLNELSKNIAYSLTKNVK